MYGAVGVTCLVLNQEAPLPVGGREKHLEMGERFVVGRPLVPLPTIYRKNARVEDKLVGVFHDLLVGIGSGDSVSVRDCVINLLPDNLNRDSGCVCLAELLVVRDPVGVRVHSVGLVQVGEQIQCTGSAIPSVRFVIDPHESVLDGIYMLLAKGAVDVVESVERQRGRVMHVADVHCFVSGGACQDDGR